jgi:hypothetical protein
VTRGLLLAIAVFLCGCATMSHPGASFAVQCNVPDAAVLVDDVMVGLVSEWSPPGRPIRPGRHRVEVRHPGYFSYYAEVQVSEGHPAQVAAPLHPLLD